MNGKNHQQKPLRVSNSGLVGTFLELKGCGERTDMTFPVVFYGPGPGSRYILPTMSTTPSVPTAGSHSFHVGYTPRTHLRVLMPVKQPGGIVLADISAEAYAEPDTVGELVQGVTNYYSPNGNLGSDVNVLRENICSGFDETQVLLNTDPGVQAYFANSLLAPNKYGLMQSLVRGGRARATPVNTLDLTVERTYDLMKQVADKEEQKRHMARQTIESVLNGIDDEEWRQLGIQTSYKGHGLFVLIGNGELQKYATHGIAPNLFYLAKHPEILEEYIARGILDKEIRYVIEDFIPREGEDDCSILDCSRAGRVLKHLIPMEGAVIIEEDGRFKENGTRIRLADRLVKIYQELGIDIHDGNAVRNYMFGVGSENQVGTVRDVGTKHITATGITLIAPETAAIILSSEENILSLIRNGRLEREYKSQVQQ